jgi:hypothetical protein
MPRGLIIFLIAVAVVAGAGVMGLPYLRRALVGEKLQVTAKFRRAFMDEHVVPSSGTGEVSRIVAELEIRFPMGRTPEKLEDLLVVGDDGKTVDVNWGTRAVEKLENDDEGEVRWVIPEAFFPPDFNTGWLRNKNVDLCYLRLPKLETAAPEQ